MRSDEVLRVLDCLDAAGVHVWLDGGWGVDGLLGEQTRDHDDLDMVIPSTDVDTAIASLAALDYGVSEDFRPTRLVLAAPDERRIDFHPIVMDAVGNGRQIGAGPAGGDAFYPVEHLSGEGNIDGRPVGCLTPDLQVLHHRGYVPALKDRHNVTLLCQRFGIQLPSEYA